jgi:hypothetical protein
METGYGLHDQWLDSWQRNEIFLFYTVHTSYGAFTTSYTKGTRPISLGVKLTTQSSVEAKNAVELHLHFPIGIVLN